MNAVCVPSSEQRVTLSVLVIEDESIHRELIERNLASEHDEQFRIVTAGSVEEACLKLAEEQFDCVILDHSLPDGSGWDVLTSMEHRLLTTPVIGLSTSGDPDIVIGDFRRGCIEFIPKSDAFRNGHLRRRLISAVMMHRRRLAAARAQSNGATAGQDAMIFAARVDGLTGVFNRAVFHNAHAEVHKRSLAHQRPYALCVIDLDNFKKYNDQYGHLEGDEVLKAVAQAARTCLRDDDLLARYGGEEFVVLMENTDAMSARLVGERMRKAVADLALPHTGNDDMGVVTISVGVTVHEPSSSETPLDVFCRADGALYTAKSSGRNAIAIEVIDSGALSS